MRTQIPNERLAFNGQLGPGALGPGTRTQTRSALGSPTDQICSIKVAKDALLTRLYEGGLSKEALLRSAS